MYIVHDEPDAIVRHFAGEFLALKQRKGSAAYHEALREKIITDLWFYIRCVLGFWYMDEHLHGQEFMSFSKENQESDSLLLVPRGHCKTLWAIAEDTQQILAKPNTAIAVITATKDLSENYSTMCGDILLKNPLIQKAFRDILPSEGKKGSWGKNGLTLPQRDPRLEKTLLSASLGTSITGQHPDKIRLDDITGKTNNNASGWSEGLGLIEEGKQLLGSVGVFKWNATHWHDAAPSRLAEQGKVFGARGRFVTKKLSCFENDDPKLPPIYDYKFRWNTGYSGYKHEDLVREMNNPSPKARAFFSAQKRNNPIAEQDIPIRVGNINIYDLAETDKSKPQLPPLGEIDAVSIETIGGGLLVFNAALESVEESGLNLPLEQFSVKRNAGIEKSDRIKAVVEPIVSTGRLWAQEWMVPNNDYDEDNLGYELKRLGAAKHDDIADALFQVCLGLEDVTVAENENAVIRIGCDIAYTEEERSDHTVLLAAAKDSQRRIWILDYERFQIQSPTAIVQRIIAFYLKWTREARSTLVEANTKKRATKIARKYS